MQKKGGEVLGDFISIQPITGLKNVVLESVFIWTVPEKYRQELINHLREQVDNIYDLCLMESYTKAHVITPDLLMKLSNSLNMKGIDSTRKETVACLMLVKMIERKGYSELSEAIEKFRAVNKCYQFISAPLQYDNLDEIKGVWLEYINKDDLKTLLKYKKIRTIIADEFREDNRFNAEFKRKVWNLIFEESPINTCLPS